MGVLEGQYALDKQVKHLELLKVDPSLVFNFGTEISSVSKLHDNTQVVRLPCQEGVHVVDYIRMSKGAQYLGLVQALLTLLFIELCQVDLLNDVQLAVLIIAGKGTRTHVALADMTHFSKSLHALN